jgi:hypothetical protein
LKYREATDFGKVLKALSAMVDRPKTNLVGVSQGCVKF